MFGSLHMHAPILGLVSLLLPLVLSSLCSCLCSPPLSCRHSTDQLKLILTRAFPKCPTPGQDQAMYFPIHNSKQRYLRINITQKSRGPQIQKGTRLLGLGSLASEGLEVRNLAAKKRFQVRSSWPAMSAISARVPSRDSLTLCRRRRTTARARPSASQPALFGWPHAAGSNLNPPSPFSSTRLRPHPRSYLNHSHLFPSYSSHSSPIFRTVSYFLMSFFTLP